MTWVIAHQGMCDSSVLAGTTRGWPGLEEQPASTEKDSTTTRKAKGALVRTWEWRTDPLSVVFLCSTSDRNHGSPSLMTMKPTARFSVPLRLAS